MVSSAAFQFKMMQKGLLLYIKDIVLDKRTPIFLLGMGFEAAGLTVQSAMGYPVIPVVDAVVAIGLAAIIMWYVKREERVQ